MLLPMSLGAIADGYNATERLKGVFNGEMLEGDRKEVDLDLVGGLIVEDAGFAWDVSPPSTSPKKSGSSKPKALPPSSSAVPPVSDGIPFSLSSITMTIPKGSLVAIVGPVGSGKTSLLQGLIGEMRKTEGRVRFGGSVGYCPQSAWIQVCFSFVNFVEGLSDLVIEREHPRKYNVWAAF